MNFAYERVPLDGPRTIRIINLQPSLYGEALRCSLETVSLDSDQKAVYDALSYVWGKPALTGTIICNGQPLRITDSCEIALRRFRRRFHDRRMWVDAICINQTDKSEQGAQVKIMRDIYVHARLVLLWIGEGDEGSDFAIQNMMVGAEYFRVHGIASDFYDMFRGPRRVLPNSRPRWMFKQVGKLKLLYHKSVRAKMYRDLVGGEVWDIVARPWFDRMWTIQELMNSQNADLVCGKYSIPWDDAHLFLSIAASTLLSEGMVLPERIWLHEKFASLYRLVRMEQLFERENIEPEDDEKGRGSDNVWEIVLWRALRALCFRKASAPVDKLYALRGVFEATKVILPDPDYSDSKPLSEIFREATVAIITQQKSLSILIMSVGMHPDVNLPSWAVDWTHETADISPYIFPENDAWRASGKAPASFRFSIDGRTLYVAGKIIDTVRSFSPGLSMAEALISESCWNCIYGIRVVHEWLALSSMTELNWDSRGSSFTSMLQSMEGNHPEAYMTNSQPPWVDIVFDKASCHREELDHFDIASLKEEMMNVWLDIATMDDNPIYRFPDDKEIKTLIHLDRHESAMSELCRDLVIGIGKTCHFVTDKDLMGMNRLAPQTGDHVAIVAGVIFPLLLREVDGGYALLGPTYIHGLMEGEFVSNDFTGWDEIALV